MISRHRIQSALLALLSGLATTGFYGATLYPNPLYADDPFLSDIVNQKKLSFDFQSIELRALLQLIAKSSGLNFVISDNVKGTITLKLTDVTWEQALSIVMKSNGLASKRTGNVVFISTIDDMAANDAKQFQSQEQLTNISPIVSKIFCLKYANAKDVAELIKGANSNLLTSRGQVAMDNRTNCVILRDIQKNITEIDHALRRIDIPAKQVSIEARIVNIDVSFEEELGVRFGLSNTTHLSGKFQGANQVASGVSPADVQNAEGKVDPTERLNFNVPAGQLFNSVNPGSIALALAHLGPILLDLELSAMEGERHGKVISRPRVVTSNQQKAVILTGEEIPYQESTSSGATSVSFKNAVLSLEVTPQITPDNRINLHIKATQDSRGETITVGVTATSGGVDIPSINTQEVESSVLLNNNETIVIGGVYKVVKNNSIERVPFFGSLPVVGYLFRHVREHDEKHELLIFVTPKIIQSNALALDTKGEMWRNET